MRHERTFYDTVEREQARNLAMRNGEFDPSRVVIDPLSPPFDPLDARYVKQIGVKDFNEFDSAMPGLIALSGLDGLEKRHAQTTMVSPDVIRDATHDDHDIHMEHDPDVEHLASPALPEETPRTLAPIPAEEPTPAPEAQSEVVREDQHPQRVSERTDDLVHLNGHATVEAQPAPDRTDVVNQPSTLPRDEVAAYDEGLYDGPPVVIGLSGGIAAGKTTVAKTLGDMGFHVIDVDAQAKSALQQPDVRESLVSMWGRSILNPHGEIDRVQVASMVLKDPAKRRVLEEVVRPYVRIDRARALRQAHDAGKTGVVLDAPQLFETGQNAECDLVMFVEASPAQRVSRAVERGWTMEHHARRESAQLSIEEKRARSHAIIVNDSTPAALAADVKAVVRQVRALVTR